MFHEVATPLPPHRSSLNRFVKIYSIKRAISTSVLTFHNHPSGDPTPSPDDVALTRRLAAAGTLIGVEVIDHLILGDARYYSLKERGEI